MVIFFETSFQCPIELDFFFKLMSKKTKKKGDVSYIYFKLLYKARDFDGIAASYTNTTL